MIGFLVGLLIFVIGSALIGIFLGAVTFIFNLLTGWKPKA